MLTFFGFITFLLIVILNMALHKICRNACYLRSGSEIIQRFHVPDDKVLWSVPFPTYDPINFTIKGLSSQPWADPEISSAGFHPLWNELDGKVDRRSHTGLYDIVSNCSRNPSGRTGITGRGRLGRWGPNHAADPIVTKWKREPNGNIILNTKTQLPILQFVSIKRQDCGQWAIPGGMIDPGEKVSVTLRREFCEEAMNSLSLPSHEKEQLEAAMLSFFDKEQIVFKGYVDDPRNTDNAWMETVACNFHDESGDIVGKFPLQAGDDACQVSWKDISDDLNLYANHIDFLKHVAVMLKAHF